MSARTIKDLVDEWGTTDDVFKGGYILPNGSMLNMTGEQAETRTFYHDMVIEDPDLDNPETQIGDFLCETGSIRFYAERPDSYLRDALTKDSPLTIYAQSCKKPTTEQLDTIKRAITAVRRFGDAELTLDRSDRKSCYIISKKPMYEDVDKFIKKCYNNQSNKR